MFVDSFALAGFHFKVHSKDRRNVMGRLSALFIIGLLTLCTGGWVFILLVPVFGGFSTWFFGLITTALIGGQQDERSVEKVSK